MSENNKSESGISIDISIGELYKQLGNGCSEKNPIELIIRDCKKCTFYIRGITERGGLYSIDIIEKNNGRVRSITNTHNSKFYPFGTPLKKIMGNYCACSPYKPK